MAFIHGIIGVCVCNQPDSKYKEVIKRKSCLPSIHSINLCRPVLHCIYGTMVRSDIDVSILRFNKKPGRERVSSGVKGKGTTAHTSSFAEESELRIVVPPVSYILPRLRSINQFFCFCYTRKRREVATNHTPFCPAFLSGTAGTRTPGPKALAN